MSGPDAGAAPPAGPRRVLLLADAYWNPHGGTEGQIRALVANLPPGWEARLWVTHHSPWLEEHPFPCRNRSLRLGSLSRPWTWLRVRRLAAEVRRGGFHLVQTFMGDSSVVGPVLGRLAGVPVLVSRRDLGFWHTPAVVAALRRTGRLAAGYVANAEAVRTHVVETEHAPAHDVAVVHNGHDPAAFDGARVPGLRASLGVPPDATVLVLLANLKPLKRQRDLVEAAGRLLARHPRLHVLLLGGGPDDEVRAACARAGMEGRVTVHHAQGGAIDLLREAAVGVLCSETEGLSNAILEYMACGLPVVATAVGGTPDLVVPEETGLLYAPGDVPALAAALDRLLGDDALRARLGAGGRRRFEDRFGLRRMVAETVAVWDRVLAGRPVGAGPGATAADAAPRGALVATLESDVERVAALAPAWRALLRPGQVFLTPEWVLTWWRWAADGAAPLAAVVRDAAGALVGLLPMARRGRALALVGADDGGDHLDVVAAAGVEDAVADACLDALLAPAAPRWRTLRLRHVAQDGALRRAVRRRRFALPYREGHATVCPFVRVEGSFDAYLARFRAKQRGNLRRQVRAWRDDPTVRRRVVTAPDEAVAAVDAVLDLHGRRFDARGRRSAFSGARVRAFHRALAPAMAAAGMLSVVLLEQGGRPVAAQYGFVHAGTRYHFQGGFDPAVASRSPGTSLTTWILEEDVFGAGLAEYDLLDGDEAYKETFATGSRRLFDLVVHRPSVLGRASALALGAGALLRDRLR